MQITDPCHLELFAAFTPAREFYEAAQARMIAHMDRVACYHTAKELVRAREESIMVVAVREIVRIEVCRVA